MSYIIFWCSQLAQSWLLVLSQYKRKKSEHSMLVLKELHWLLVKQRLDCSAVMECVEGWDPQFTAFSSVPWPVGSWRMIQPSLPYTHLQYTSYVIYWCLQTEQIWLLELSQVPKKALHWLAVKQHLSHGLLGLTSVWAQPLNHPMLHPFMALSLLKPVVITSWR